MNETGQKIDIHNLSAEEWEELICKLISMLGYNIVKSENTWDTAMITATKRISLFNVQRHYFECTRTVIHAKGLIVDFMNRMNKNNCTYGTVISTYSYGFTPTAIIHANDNSIQLIEREEFSSLMKIHCCFDII